MGGAAFRKKKRKKERKKERTDIGKTDDLPPDLLFAYVRSFFLSEANMIRTKTKSMSTIIH